VIVVGLVSATITWVATAGSVWVWNAETGRLRVPDAGPVVAPLWAGERLDATRLTAEIPAATADGAKVATTVGFTPPVGVWQLEGAATPSEGLRRSVADAIRREVGSLPLACFAEGSAGGGCPPDVSAVLRRTLAMDLGVPEGAVSVLLEPDRTAVRAGLLGEIAGQLDLPEHKVLVLGLDGLDWDLVLPWVEAGRMPNLKRLMDAGTWGTMTTIVPGHMQQFWETAKPGGIGN